MRKSDTGVAVQRIRVLGRPTFGGLVIALMLWLPALTPTLIPRMPATQAGINAVALAMGYGIGTLIGLCLRLVLLRNGRSVARGVRRIGWIVLGLGWLSGVLLGAVLWLTWQNDQRRLMGMETVDGLDAVLMVSVSVLGGVMLVVIGRLIAKAVLAVTRLSRRLLPSVPAAPPIGLVVFFLGTVLVGWGGWLGITAFANATFGSANASTDEGTVQPGSASVSGSSESLVPWGTLGRWGRNFVASATTAELGTFHDADAELSEPVRVYVGLDSAGSASERAELAVRELDRAGGFDREVLVVWVPTGTGWVIPEAADALELLHRGDTAIVATQYSFLPSLLAVFMEPGREIESASALYSAVHSHWSDLPRDDRPKLLLFGKSLGTVGVEAPFVGADASESIANLTSGTQGALIVGAKRTNPIHSQLTRERDQGSSVWQPVIDSGLAVRFLSRDPDQPALSQDWPLPRIVYLQHPSDPVPLWGIDVLWRSPEWMDQPRGFDVSEAAGWYPVVSGVHAAADLIFQLDTPPGFGHVYATEYVEGWASVCPPDGWTDADTARLEEFLYSEPPSEEQP